MFAESNAGEAASTFSIERLAARMETARAPAPRGAIFSEPSIAGRAGYFAYLPEKRPALPPLICIHGISRNAMEHVHAFSSLADRYGFPVVTPLFLREDYRRYQTLGGLKKLDSLQSFLRVLDHAQGRLGGGFEKFHLFGFSGGGQFAHRFALRHPERVGSLALAAAGWYTMPSHALRFPFGLGGFAAEASLVQFLAIPSVVYVGAGDTQRDPALNRKARIDRLQGRDRVSRARSWVDAINSEAKQRLMPSPAEFVLLDGVGHSFADAFKSAMGADVAARAYGGGRPSVNNRSKSL